MSFLRTPVVLIALLALSCSSSGSSDPGANGGPPPADEPPVGVSKDALRVVIPTHTVQPGDTFECFYTDITPDHDLFVNGTTGKQSPGGHHITVYYATQSLAVGHHPCNDLEMMNWRQIGAAGQEAGNGTIDLPEGVATRVPKGHQIVVQTHYINATSAPKDVQDEITVRLLQQSDVKAYATPYAMVDLEFKIPAQGITNRTATCTMKKDYDFLLMLGHMHELGSHYKLERVDANGTSVETLFDEDWQGSYVAHPPTKRWPLEAPMHIAAGTKLRQTCSWKNTTTDEIAFPREMCVMFGSYLADEEMFQCTDLEVSE